MQQEKLFERVFSDAAVVDIDLSAWDKQITFYVIAGHMPYTEDRRIPLFVVEFIRVRSWNITFNHLSHEPPINLGPDEHIHWLIYDSSLYPEEDGLHITLWGPSASPNMNMVCEDVTIRAMQYDILDNLFPGWSKPGGGFIRPGLAAMSRGI